MANSKAGNKSGNFNFSHTKTEANRSSSPENLFNCPNVCHQDHTLERTRCERFVINQKTTDYKLRIVANQLANLILMPMPSQAGEKLSATCPYVQRENLDRYRIKTILSLYTKLLETSPLVCSLPIVENLFDYVNKQRKLDFARQQVLILIESLDGYCDLINHLRQMLKSTPMIAAISAFDKIVREIRQQKLRDSLLNSREAYKTEPRVVFEWSV